MTKAFVTGASGFVGSTLCDELLRRGIETRALMRKTSSSANLGTAKVIPVQGDLRDPDSLVAAIGDADIVFHVAGLVKALSREDLFASNEQGTRNVLEAVKRSGRKIQRFVYVSSLAAAGPSTPERCRVESDPNAPVSLYGESKLGGEKAALEYQKDFPVTIVRPPSVYGPRDKEIFSFFETINFGALPVLGMENPDPRRYSFVHVDDLVQGIVAAALTPNVPSGEIFYITGDGEYSWENAMELIARGLKKKTFRLRLPIVVMRIAAAISTLISKILRKPAILSLDKIKEIEAMAWSCSNKKAKEKLGFEPYWTLEKGFEQTGRWYRENGWLK